MRKGLQSNRILRRLFLSSVAAMITCISWACDGRSDRSTSRRGSLESEPSSQASRARKLLDILWVWGIPEGIGAYEIPQGEMISTRDPARFAEADAASKAAILGVSNVAMAGHGLPRDLEAARKISRSIAHLKRVAWEMTPDEGEGPHFVYEQKLAVLSQLRQTHSQIEAVLIDDMLTSQKEQGLRPKHIARLRRQLHQQLPGLKMWGIVYTKNLQDPLLPECVEVLDVINLWTWEAEELTNLEANFAATEKLSRGRPIVLGLYMYDYHKERKMPRALMELQCQKALELARSGRIQGIVFLAVNNDPETIEWTREWIQRVGNESLPAGPQT